MTTSDGVIAAWMGLYFAVFWPLLVGTWRLRRSLPIAGAAGGRVSVVVSARNEARDLPRCIDALLALDYPRDLLEIILVDDLSDDATGRIIDAVARTNAHVRAIHTSALPDNGLEAKARGLAHGMALATGDWVLITDADAAVPPLWVRHLLGGVTPAIGMVGGAVVIETDAWWSVPERISWGFLQQFALGLAGLGFPIICVGPNMGIRRATYRAAGGLERAPFRVAEDLALFLMVRRAGLGVLVSYSPETTVMVRAVPSVVHLFSQHRRWLAGGMEQGRAIAVALWMVMGWGAGVAAYMLAGWLLSWPLWALFMAGKLGTDWCMLRAQQRTLALPHHARYLPVLQLLQVVAMAFLPVSFLWRRTVRWRGEGYQVRYR